MEVFIIAGVVAIIAAIMIIAIFFRVVVPTNEVHIVQSAKSTVSYGKDQPTGNTYYAWPSWIPRIGIRTIRLPVSVFQLPLNDYAAYDKGRVPFVIDIMAFFRITDSNVAAQRISTFGELQEQLEAILQGAARTILAKSDIEEILEGRAQFGELFTTEVDGQLTQWGVQSVKCIELMDIRDAKESKVIANIMEKKKSLIEKESRTEVARNRKEAEMAEIDAKREVQVRAQEAEQQVGIRTAEKDQAVGISKQQAQQAIKDQEKVTTEKQMAVSQVEHVRAAEISRDVAVVKAQEKKQTDVISAEGEKQKTVLTAEGTLEAERRAAEAIQVKGAATAEAEKLLQLAPVQAQITLAKEIGENDGYQSYLIEIRKVEKDQAVGVEQAQALKAAEVKVIVNSGDVNSGIDNIAQVFTAKGGTHVASMLEALAQSPSGSDLIKRFTGKGDSSK